MKRMAEGNVGCRSLENGIGRVDRNGAGGIRFVWLTL